MVTIIKEVKDFIHSKVCTRCKKEKSYVDFDYKGNTNRYLKSRCRDCINKIARDSPEKREYMRQYGIINKETLASTRLVRKYGITLEQKKKMLSCQDNRCKICNKSLNIEYDPRDVHVDHNHNNGKVRGILCSKCNTALGAFQENVDILYKAIEYLLDKDFNIEQLIKLETYDS